MYSGFGSFGPPCICELAMSTYTASERCECDQRVSESDAGACCEQADSHLIHCLVYTHPRNDNLRSLFVELLSLVSHDDCRTDD